MDSLVKQILDQVQNPTTEHIQAAHFAAGAYMELSEVKKVESINCQYDKELETFYFLVRFPNEGSEVFIPLAVNKKVTPAKLQMLQDKLSPETRSVTLMIIDGDSSSTYYKVTSGLVRPLSPEAAQKKQLEKTASKELKSQISKNKHLLYSEALRKRAEGRNIPVEADSVKCESVGCSSDWPSDEGAWVD